MSFLRRKKKESIVPPPEPAPPAPEPIADGAPPSKTEGGEEKPAEEVAMTEKVPNGDVQEKTEVTTTAEVNDTTLTKETNEETNTAPDGKGAPTTEATTEKKSEKSPLIDKDAKEVKEVADETAAAPKSVEKEAKVKDTGPGFLCCTIM